jgi:hypothetical protein
LGEKIHDTTNLNEIFVSIYNWKTDEAIVKNL